MKVEMLRNIQWFLEDNGLLTILEGLHWKENEKRSYFTSLK